MWLWKGWCTGVFLDRFSDKCTGLLDIFFNTAPLYCRNLSTCSSTYYMDVFYSLRKQPPHIGRLSNPQREKAERESRPMWGGYFRRLRVSLSKQVVWLICHLWEWHMESTPPQVLDVVLYGFSEPISILKAQSRKKSPHTVPLRTLRISQKMCPPC